jgi:hypothetical protein
MLTLGQLVEEPWEVRTFHLWYIHAAKLGIRDIIVKAPKEYVHLEDGCSFTVDFYDMHRLLRRKDLDIAQVTFFAL